MDAEEPRVGRAVPAMTQGRVAAIDYGCRTDARKPHLTPLRCLSSEGVYDIGESEGPDAEHGHPTE
jgi:hypothetical protein